MFICTNNKETYKKFIERGMKLIQETKIGDKTLYTFAFNAKIYSLFENDKSVFISNKLFFNAKKRR